MTGQTFKKIDINWPQPVFAHDQLYLAFSCVSTLANRKVKIENNENRLFNRKWKIFYYVIYARTVNKNFKLENLNKFLKSIKATISSGEDSINNLLLKNINNKLKVVLVH